MVCNDGNEYEGKPFRRQSVVYLDGLVFITQSKSELKKRRPEVG